MADNVLTPEFRVSFAYVFRPSKPMAGDENKEPKYTITMRYRCSEEGGSAGGGR
jgi:hypothetical protein